MTETDGGQFLVSFLTPGGPAEQAGMNLGARITSLDEMATSAAVAANTPWSSPFSNPVIKRLQQARFALRFPLSKSHVAVTFQNQGAAVRTVNLQVVAEQDSFRRHPSSSEALPTRPRLSSSGSCLTVWVISGSTASSTMRA